MSDLIKDIQGLSDTLTHKALEIEDIKLESKIDQIALVVGETNKEIKEVKDQVKFTNGKVRKHQVWIAGIVGGAIVFMFFVTLFRDALVKIVADAVVTQIAEKYDPLIKR